MEIAAYVFGVLGLACGVVFGLRLRAWERQLAGARIAVAYKQKVRLQAPLVEWLTWANMLAKDEQSTGRVVYRQASTTVAILKPRPRHGRSKSRTVKGPPAGQTTTHVTGNK